MLDPDFTFDDDQTLIQVRDEEIGAQPPALPFPLVRRKAAPEPPARALRPPSSSRASRAA